MTNNYYSISIIDTVICYLISDILSNNDVELSNSNIVVLLHFN